jgi:uncharacterized protein YxeA
MKKIIYLVIILILIGGGFYLWQNRHEYFFQGEDPYEIYNDNDDNEKKGGGSRESDGGENQLNDNKDDDVVIENIVGEEKNQELLDILQNHCDNSCEDKENTDDYDYCLEICGLNGGISQLSDCESLADDFERDVCYKNQAIEEKNSGICNNISDSRLMENCKDRVIEELFN